MPPCEVCGHDGGDSFEVDGHDRVHTFDTLECALTGLAPRCANCGTRVVGRGIESQGAIYCIPCARSCSRSQRRTHAAGSLP